MTAVIEEITRWATHNLPFWEQAALDRIIAGGPITDEVMEELLDYLLEDAGLQEKKRQRPHLSCLAMGSSSIDSNGSRYKLVRIHNLKNINALVPNQRLDFGKDLTVIFGSNGSGKSGYARVIGSAAFTRGDKEILRNVTSAQQSDEPLSADIDLVSDDGQTTTIHYVVGNPCPQLRSFYVFDSTSVKNHLTKENPMSFSPAGLEYLTSLSALTDRVRRALDERCAAKDCSKNVFDPLFVGETKVKAYIKVLGPSTDLKVLEKLANVTEEEKGRIDSLGLQIAEIRSQKIVETIGQLTQEISDLEGLRDSIITLEEWMRSDQVNEVNDLIEEYQKYDMQIHTSSRTGKLAAHPFSRNRFQWEEFIRAAYRLGRSDSHEYPKIGDRCLLCNQPLSDESRDLIERIWESINNEIAAKKDEVERKLRSHASTVQEYRFDILDPKTAAYRCIKRHNPEALERIRSNLAATERACDELQMAIGSRRPAKIEPICIIGSEEIQKIISLLQEERQALVDQNTEQILQLLEREKLELEHRVILSGQIGAISEFVQRAKWVKQASTSSVRRSTLHITRKYNELFDQLVTQRYIQLFEQTLSKLECPLRVKVETRGKKGETRKQIVLLREDNQSCTDATPDKILSEGEQRAVALADFLTEVALDDNSSGILLDDPVTSLDFQWKETIAQHIVEEASRQQVIVFTHDLHFMYCIKKFANEKEVDLCGHWIKKRDDKPGWVFLNNSPASEKEFKSSAKARDYCQKAKNPALDAEEEQDFLSSGFGALRTSYEVFIMNDLFGGVVQRFDERISGDRLRNVYVDESIRDEVIESIGRLSRFINAHSHSDAHSLRLPAVKNLEEEIVKFDALKARHKEIKKNHGIKD